MFLSRLLSIEKLGLEGGGGAWKQDINLNVKLVHWTLRIISESVVFLQVNATACEIKDEYTRIYIIVIYIKRLNFIFRPPFYCQSSVHSFFHFFSIYSALFRHAFFSHSFISRSFSQVLASFVSSNAFQSRTQESWKWFFLFLCEKPRDGDNGELIFLVL